MDETIYQPYDCNRAVDTVDGAVSVVRMRAVDTVDSTVLVILIRLACIIIAGGRLGRIGTSCSLGHVGKSAVVNAVGAGCLNTWTKAGGALVSRGTDVVSLRRR